MNSRMYLGAPVVVICSMVLASSCGVKLTSFDDVRDFIMKESGHGFHTTIELTLTTDHLGFLSDYVRDFDIDTGTYYIARIETVELGIYRVEDADSLNIREQLPRPKIRKLFRRLERAGYESVLHTHSNEEISLGLIRESRESGIGSGYFVQIKPRRFILIKIDGDIRKR